MSERPHPLPPEAQALARWTVLLMGWVWLGAQGQRLGWSIASGVVPVVLWWSVRLLATGSPWLRRWPTQAPRILGMATAAVSLLVAAWPGVGHTGLLGLAVVWGLWSALLESRSGHGRCGRRWSGWPPLLAAGLTALGTVAPWPTPVTASVSAAVLLLAAGLSPTGPCQEPPRRAVLHPGAALPASAMGLMMGSLWLGNVWCNAAGWSTAELVGWHLGLMALLPAFTRADLIPRHLPTAATVRLPLVLLCVGSGVLIAGTQAKHDIAGMVLLALAWAVHTGRYHHAAPSWPALVWTGPVLLLAVGLTSPTQGPQSLQWAYGVLGVLALLVTLKNGLADAPQASPPSTWKDAS